MTVQPANRLAHEKSPYLLQHATNPVDWYPWGEEAFAKSKGQDKPIILSVGYSACHWCHVMAHESFSDPKIAELMNRYFISIKVDREERPDIDKAYQEASHLLTHQGGWPLTVFLTPEGKPFYAGTYFPPEERWGHPGFRELVANLGRSFTEKRSEFEKLAQQLSEAVKDALIVREPGTPEGMDQRLASIVKAGRENLFRYFDAAEGGFGGAPKFPSVPNLELFWSSPEAKHREAVLFTLTRMISGGIYDQLGGGFHRYSTDEHWLVPHFEKMLYDNALLIDLLTRAYAETGQEALAKAARESADYLLREMATEKGGFAASQDADLHGEEGGYYVWSMEEIQEVLPPAEASEFINYFGVTTRGNFEGGRSVLYRNSADSTSRELAQAKKKMFEARSKREKPFRDDKILASWNGLAIGALAQAGGVLKEARYIQAAQESAEFILRDLRSPDGGLLRSYMRGPSDIPGFAEDYAFLIAGLLRLYAVTSREDYFAEALKLQKVQLEELFDTTEGGFFMGQPDPGIFTRPKESTDEAVPSGAMVSLLNMLQLIKLNPELAQEYEPYITATLSLYINEAADNPWGYATYLRSAQGYLER